MERVTGIGGIFFKVKNKESLVEWYREFLGIPVESWGGMAFQWSSEDQPSSRPGQTIWSLFPEDSTYFGAPEQRFMINFRVRDLHTLLAELREKGAQVDSRVETSEYGIFGWVTDPEGNRIELWQPPESAAS